ncbi:Protein kinase alk2 [Kappamyces sp. JEL0680]|nr:Protein kinase alk2 [Kappamyces sp. JEL0680]
MSDLIAPVAVLASTVAFLLRYRHDAVGSTHFLDPKLPRFYTHIPVIGSLRALLEDIDMMSEALSHAFQVQNTDKLVFSMPGSIPILMTINPKDVEHILSTNFENYVKGEAVNSRMSVMFGNGIFATDGAHWYFERKVASKVFTTKAFKNIFETVFMDNIHRLIAILNQKAESMEQVDMHDLFLRFFMDSFAKIAFGIEMDSLSGKDVPFANSFDRGQTFLVDRFFNPFFKIKEMLDGKIQLDFQLVRDFGRKVVEDRRAGLLDTSEVNLISLFEKYRDDDGNALTDEQMIDQVVNFLIAGRDTTAQALSWTLYCLSHNPGVVPKMREEYQTLVGESDIPTYDQVKQLKYHKAVMNETLRLYPSVPKNIKLAVKDDVLPDGTRIQAGQLVSWNPYAMGRSDRIWKDPLHYSPERWLNGQTYSQYEYPAFNAGPRICLGKTLAELQGVLVLSTLFQHFDFHIVDPSSITAKASLTLPMKNGLRVTVSKRY